MATPSRRPLAVLLATICTLAPSVGATSAARAAGPAEGEREIVKELLATRDASDPERVLALAAIGTREALDGLIEVYNGVGSLFMRREIVRALATFDDTAAAEPALEFIANVATQATEPDLREAAVLALGDCDKLGKLFLRKIVESPAADEVRELALETHLRRAAPEDDEWYRLVYRTPPPTDEERDEKKKKAKLDKVRAQRGDTVEEKVHIPRVPELRVLAFEHLLGKLDAEELVEALKDNEPRIQAVALEELERRGDKRALTAAEGFYANLEAWPLNRALAAGVIARARGTEAADSFIEMGERQITPHVLRNELADLLRGMHDPDVEKKLMRSFGKGKRHEKQFALRATKDSKDPKYTDKVAKLARDKDPEVATAALAVIAERGDPEALPEVEKLLEKSKDVFVRRTALEALATLTRKASGFDEAELFELLENEDVAVRNLALRELGQDSKHVGLLLTALEDPHWSTRVVAVDGLVRLRSAEAVPAMIERMGREQGRFIELFADSLWRLTGQPFETSIPRWRAWWEREGAGFEPISEAELAGLEDEREERRLRAVSRVEKEFFGIEIVSQHVIFVLDISGSMREQMRQTSVGGAGGKTRLDVAKEQLRKAIEDLDETALFNVIVFDIETMTWNDGIVPAVPDNKVEARQWVDRLGLGSATNLYGALRRAFEDPDVDTLYVVSDGVPMGGEKDDPEEIREDVARWNANRGIVIHTITVGGKLQILQALAEDSGGSHVRLQ